VMLDLDRIVDPIAECPRCGVEVRQRNLTLHLVWHLDPGGRGQDVVIMQAPIGHCGSADEGHGLHLWAARVIGPFQVGQLPDYEVRLCGGGGREDLESLRGAAG
jgi:hypothetical protein